MEIRKGTITKYGVEYDIIEISMEEMTTSDISRLCERFGDRNRRRIIVARVNNGTYTQVPCLNGEPHQDFEDNAINEALGY